MHKFSCTIGDGINTEFLITHNLKTMNILTSLRTNSSPSEFVLNDIFIIDENTIRLVFSSAPSNSEFVLTVLG